MVGLIFLIICFNSMYIDVIYFLVFLFVEKKEEKKCNLRFFFDNFVNLICDWEV